MSRLPIRIRLAAAAAAGTMLVLATAGLLLYGHVRASLDRTVDHGLKARAADVAALVRQSDTGLRESSAGIAQVLDTRGRVFDTTPGLARPLLGPGRLGFVTHGQVRLYARPVRAQDRRLVVVVGASLADRNTALAELRASLVLGAPVALLVSSLLGYLLAAAAVRPIEAALARERAFVADASHELRTPLALLQAELELALERPRTHRELRAALVSASEEADRLAHLADDLLLLARVDRGALPIRRERIDLEQLLAGVARRFARRAAEAGRAIHVVAEGAVDADRLRLEQALANLLDNALRHGAGTIRLEAEPGTIRVSDEGAGFPPELVPHAFERFAGSGTGLGLAIVAAIAEAHGGSATIEPSSTVAIRLRYTPRPHGSSEAKDIQGAARQAAHALQARSSEPAGVPDVQQPEAPAFRLSDLRHL